ncbi:MAG: GNAT family N-acetyltransferase [Anaerolineae bacterium]|nr:GNAT family N-acetyltransferase [Anaerolineae bacterium]
MEEHRDGYTLSTDKARLDVENIQTFLSERSYWAQGRSREVVERAIEGSLCFGIYAQQELVAFARVVTDYATFGWVCDVFVFETHRGRGLGKWLIEAVVRHPELQGLKRLLLATRDAQGLYREYGGFAPLQAPERWMERLMQPLAAS